MKRRRWVVGAVAVLIVAACSPGDVVEVVAAPPVAVTTTAVPTTAPAGVPSATFVPPTPVEIGVAPTLIPVETVEAPATAVVETPQAATPAPTAGSDQPDLTPTVPAITQATAVPTRPPSEPSSQAVLAANGGEVYTLTCARCHGERGFGTAQHNGLLGIGSRYSNAAMIDELTTGHPFTFGFADKLSPDEIASVAAYVKAAFP